MKAVILAGGQGTRLRPLSYSVPKQLLPIAGRPALGHILFDIEACGINDVAIVTSPEARATVVEMLEHNSELGFSPEILIQPKPDGLAAAYEVALDWVDDGPCVVYLGDCLLTGGIQHVISEHVASEADATIMVKDVDDPSRYGIVEVGLDGRVRRLVEKPSEPVSDLAIVGVYVFGAGTARHVKAVEPSWRGEREITDALQLIIDSGGVVMPSSLRGWWIDTGTIPDVIHAQQLLFAELDESIDGTVDSSKISGTLRLGHGSTLRGSTVHGPVLIGEGVTVEDSVIGPNVAIGDRSSLRAATVADSILMDDVDVTYSSLSGSVLGPRSVVAGLGSHEPRRVIVGADASIGSGDINQA